MIEVITGLPSNVNPIWGCQVLTAVNAKSPLARKELNKILQAELNPNGGIDGQHFRVADKIVNTKNGHFPSIKHDANDPDIQAKPNGDVYVANGELAEVLEIEEKNIIAKLSAPSRTIRIPRGKANQNQSDEEKEEDKTGTGCSWELGYALSTHKSQGSEWPVVIVMLDEYPGARIVCSREWLYTAISRAKERCVLIGQQQTANAMCRNIALGNRKTLLKELILLEQAKLVLGEI